MITGVILSAPLLLFPSFDSSPPTFQILKDTTIAIASRLAQVPHQEAVLKSLMRIRDVVGQEEFESYLVDYDDKIMKNIEILSKIYNINCNKKKERKNQTYIVKTTKECSFDKSWDSDSDTSGIAEEEEETPNSAIPSARIVLETEIKFNEETAITMTILEEKEKDITDGCNMKDEVKEITNTIEDPSLDKRKTPRRVHFGGEIVKMRTPDSDETESIELASKTRIPLPVSPATKMPEDIKRQPSSQPGSPHTRKPGTKRVSRSASSSPKKETYVHNAQLSPKKSILMKPGDSALTVNSSNELRNAKNSMKENIDEAITKETDSLMICNVQEVSETSRKEQIQTIPSSADNGKKLIKSNDNNRAKDEKDLDVSKSPQTTSTENSKKVCSKEEQPILEKDIFAIDSNTNNISDISSRQENTTMDPSNLEGQKAKENIEKNMGTESQTVDLNTQKTNTQNSTNNCPYGPEMNLNKDDFAFGSPVHQYNTGTNRLIGGAFVNDEQDIDIPGAMTSGMYDDDEIPMKENDLERKWRRQFNRKSASEGNGSVTCSSSEGESKPQEPSWEELGLVDQEVLDDLHNKVRKHIHINAEFFIISLDFR